MRKWVVVITVALALAFPQLALAQTPNQVVHWVLQQYPGLEGPDEIRITEFSAEAWAEYIAENNISADVVAATNLLDFEQGLLHVRMSPLAQSDFFLLHEILHWIESAAHGHTLPQVSHSENVVWARVITIMCGGPDYRDWKLQFDSGWPALPPGAFCGPDGGLYTQGQ
ncbi:MAG: hypothetical protein ACYS7Y_29990 [Planctomycetota bacterium]|jgi:hypothetical protein